MVRTAGLVDRALNLLLIVLLEMRTLPLGRLLLLSEIAQAHGLVRRLAHLGRARLDHLCRVRRLDEWRLCRSWFWNLAIDGRILLHLKRAVSLGFRQCVRPDLFDFEHVSWQDPCCTFVSMQDGRLPLTLLRLEIAHHIPSAEVAAHAPLLRVSLVANEGL